MNPLRPQRGYLMEIPLLLTAVVIGVVVLLPVLPPMGRKILVVIATFPVLFCLYYMMVTPGWTPGCSKRIGPVLRWIAFALVTVTVVGGVLWFVLA